MNKTYANNTLEILHATGWSKLSCSEKETVRMSSLLNVLIHPGHRSDSDSAHITENVLFYCHESVVLNYEGGGRESERAVPIIVIHRMPTRGSSMINFVNGYF